MKGKRRQHGADFKARVALAAVKGDKTINEIAAIFEVHPNLVGLWRRKALAELPRVFSEQQTQSLAQGEFLEIRRGPEGGAR